MLFYAAIAMAASAGSYQKILDDSAVAICATQ
ncbi:hypothetical protein CLU84_1092 [Comamonas sp. 26]|nr:hypothetical protein CLU84_1092 [Comamonas sp. 26]